MNHRLPVAAAPAAPAVTVAWKVAAPRWRALLACLALQLALAFASGASTRDLGQSPAFAAGMQAVPDDGLPPAPPHRASPLKKSRVTGLAVRRVPARTPRRTAFALDPVAWPQAPQVPVGPTAGAHDPSSATSVARHPTRRLPPGQAPPAA